MSYPKRAQSIRILRPGGAFYTLGRLANTSRDPVLTFHQDPLSSLFSDHHSWGLGDSKNGVTMSRNPAISLFRKHVS